jgi:hypothetical protein
MNISHKAHKTADALNRNTGYVDHEQQGKEVIKRKFNYIDKTYEGTSDDVRLIKTKKLGKKSSALSIDMLLSDEGLVKVYKTFPTSCKFRGKGYENQDLRNLLTSYKEWAWMLNPGSAFPDFLNKCETLGRVESCRTFMNHLRELEKADFKQRIQKVKVVKNVSFAVC